MMTNDKPCCKEPSHDDRQIRSMCHLNSRVTVELALSTFIGCVFFPLGEQNMFHSLSLMLFKWLGQAIASMYMYY